jgi:putative redox protein
MTLEIEWKGAMAFESTPPSGVRFTMDAHPESGGQGLGPTPVEALVSALGACTAMDVISILAKKRQTVTAYKVEVEYERGPDGVFPRPVVSAVVRHLLTGKDLDSEAVARAVQLSDEKYCSVLATLRTGADVRSTWEIVA